MSNNDLSTFSKPASKQSLQDLDKIPQGPLEESHGSKWHQKSKDPPRGRNCRPNVSQANFDHSHSSRSHKQKDTPKQNGGLLGAPRPEAGLPSAAALLVALPPQDHLPSRDNTISPNKSLRGRHRRPRLRTQSHQATKTAASEIRRPSGLQKAATRRAQPPFGRLRKSSNAISFWKSLVILMHLWVSAVVTPCALYPATTTINRPNVQFKVAHLLTTVSQPCNTCWVSCQCGTTLVYHYCPSPMPQLSGASFPPGTIFDSQAGALYITIPDTDWIPGPYSVTVTGGASYSNEFTLTETAGPSITISSGTPLRTGCPFLAYESYPVSFSSGIPGDYEVSWTADSVPVPGRYMELGNIYAYIGFVNIGTLPSQTSIKVGTISTAETFTVTLRLVGTSIFAQEQHTVNLSTESIPSPIWTFTSSMTSPVQYMIGDPAIQVDITATLDASICIGSQVQLTSDGLHSSLQWLDTGETWSNPYIDADVGFLETASSLVPTSPATAGSLPTNTLTFKFTIYAEPTLDGIPEDRAGVSTSGNTFELQAVSGKLWPAEVFYAPNPLDDYFHTMDINLKHPCINTQLIVPDVVFEAALDPSGSAITEMKPLGTKVKSLDIPVLSWPKILEDTVSQEFDIPGYCGVPTMTYEIERVSSPGGIIDPSDDDPIANNPRDCNGDDFCVDVKSVVLRTIPEAYKVTVTWELIKFPSVPTQTAQQDIVMDPCEPTGYTLIQMSPNKSTMDITSETEYQIFMPDQEASWFFDYEPILPDCEYDLQYMASLQSSCPSGAPSSCTQLSFLREYDYNSGKLGVIDRIGTFMDNKALYIETDEVRWHGEYTIAIEVWIDVSIRSDLLLMDYDVSFGDEFFDIFIHDRCTVLTNEIVLRNLPNFETYIDAQAEIEVKDGYTTLTDQLYEAMGILQTCGAMEYQVFFDDKDVSGVPAVSHFTIGDTLIIELDCPSIGAIKSKMLIRPYLSDQGLNYSEVTSQEQFEVIIWALRMRGSKVALSYVDADRKQIYFDKSHLEWSPSGVTPPLFQTAMFVLSRPPTVISISDSWIELFQDQRGLTFGPLEEVHEGEYIIQVSVTVLKFPGWTSNHKIIPMTVLPTRGSSENSLPYFDPELETIVVPCQGSFEYNFPEVRDNNLNDVGFIHEIQLPPDIDEFLAIRTKESNGIKVPVKIEGEGFGLMYGEYPVKVELVDLQLASVEQTLIIELTCYPPDYDKEAGSFGGFIGTDEEVDQEYLPDPPVAEITDFSIDGIMTISFTNAMQNFTNYTFIEHETVEVFSPLTFELVQRPNLDILLDFDPELTDEALLNFTWNVISYEPKSLKIQLLFANPSQVSTTSIVAAEVIFWDVHTYRDIHNQELVQAYSYLESDDAFDYTVAGYSIAIPPQVSPDNILLKNSNLISGGLVALAFGNLGIKIFTSTAAQHLLSSITALSLLVHLFLINGYVSAESGIFFGALTTFVNYDYIPKIEVPLTLMFNFRETQAMSANASALEYDSKFAILNLGSISAFLVLIPVAVLLGKLLMNRCRYERGRRCGSWIYKGLVWNGILTFVDASYFYFCLTSLIEIRLTILPTPIVNQYQQFLDSTSGDDGDLIEESRRRLAASEENQSELEINSLFHQDANRGDYISLVFSCLALLYVLIYPWMIVWFLRKNYSSKILAKDKEFSEKFGSLHENLKSVSKGRDMLTFKAIQLYHKLLFCMILVLMQENPGNQLQLMMALQTAKIILTAYWDPFIERLAYKDEMFGDLLIILMSYCFMTSTEFGNPLARRYTGWFMIVSVGSFCIYYLIRHMVYSCRDHKRNKWLAKQKLQWERDMAERAHRLRYEMRDANGNMLTMYRAYGVEREDHVLINGDLYWRGTPEEAIARRRAGGGPSRPSQNELTNIDIDASQLELNPEDLNAAEIPTHNKLVRQRVDQLNAIAEEPDSGDEENPQRHRFIDLQASDGSERIRQEIIDAVPSIDSHEADHLVAQEIDYMQRRADEREQQELEERLEREYAANYKVDLRLAIKNSIDPAASHHNPAVIKKVRKKKGRRSKPTVSKKVVPKLDYYEQLELQQQQPKKIQRRKNNIKKSKQRLLQGPTSDPQERMWQRDLAAQEQRRKAELKAKKKKQPFVRIIRVKVRPLMSDSPIRRYEESLTNQFGEEMIDTTYRPPKRTLQPRSKKQQMARNLRKRRQVLAEQLMYQRELHKQAELEREVDSYLQKWDEDEKGPLSPRWL